MESSPKNRCSKSDVTRRRKEGPPRSISTVECAHERARTSPSAGIWPALVAVAPGAAFAHPGNCCLSWQGTCSSPELVAVASKLAGSAAPHKPIDLQVPATYEPKTGPNPWGPRIMPTAAPLLPPGRKNTVERPASLGGVGAEDIAIAKPTGSAAQDQELEPSPGALEDVSA